MAYLTTRGFKLHSNYGLPLHVQQFDGSLGATPLRVEIEYVDLGKGAFIEADVSWSGRGWYRYVFPGQAQTLSRDLGEWWQSYKAVNP